MADANAIKAGAVVDATYWPEAVYKQDTGNLANITSTSFVTGSPVLSVTFTAPASGRVMVCVGFGGRADSSNNRIFLAPNIYEGTSSSGTEVLAANVEWGVGTGGVNSGGLAQYRGTMKLLQGLTPGATYFAQTVHAVTGGTDADILSRDILIFPVP